MLAGAACAALMIPAVPAQAANSPNVAPTSFASAGDPTVAAFYASRRGAPLWFSHGPDSAAARELFSVLERAPLDGFDAGPALAAQAQLLIGRGDLAGADRTLSAAWVRYVSALQTPPSGMIYADS